MRPVVGGTTPCYPPLYEYSAGVTRASPTDAEQRGQSWIPFIDDHWGSYQCLRYQLRLPQRRSSR
jgi:hypothetical protein